MVDRPALEKSPVKKSQLKKSPFRKSLGQHHLRDVALCRPLVDFLAPSGRLVVEIGPGGGVLTEALRRADARVWAWELDRSWAFRAARRFSGDDATSFVVGDALDLPWGRLPGAVRVAGNLPYNVATALIDRLLRHPERYDRAAFLLQLEVAQRLVAEPGSKAYGALSVLTRARAAVRLLGRVRPGSFEPPPKVESAFVGLEPRRGPVAVDELDALRAVVHAAFGQRRKTLLNALSARWPRSRVAAAIHEAGLPAGARAEQLSLPEFAALLKPLGSV